MLIDSPRLTGRDRATWQRLAHYDDALSRARELDEPPKTISSTYTYTIRISLPCLSKNKV